MARDFECSFDTRFAIPGTSPQYLPDRTFDAKHIKLEFDIDVARRVVRGSCHTTLRPLADRLVFNAVDMKIRSVRIDGKKVKYTYKGGEISLHTPGAKKDTVVSIEYILTDPKAGVYFIQPDRKYPNKPVQVWTHSETEDARYWYPCADTPDSKATTEMLITVPKGFLAVSNGVLESTKRKAGKITYHWKMKHLHSPYLVMFAVGRFAEVRDRWRNVEVVYYCEKGQEASIRKSFGLTPKMLDFFSRKIGVPYPYEKYAQVAVEDFIFGGMEHTTATTQTNTVLLDSIAEKEFWDRPIALAAHELAHQWFGDFLTCRDWSHAWLNESFATYFEALFMQHEFGNEMFQWEMHRNAAAYFDEDQQNYRRPISTNIYFTSSDVFDRHLYEKGAWVLHMIRCILGEERWWKSINTYVKDNANSVVETADFINAIRKATGVNMRKFFDQWIFKAGHPEYLVKYSWDSKKKEALVRVVQQQQTSDETPLFSMPVTLEFETPEGIKTFTETVDGKQHLFRYKLDSEPKNFRFDPDECILKKLTLVKPKSMFYSDLYDKRAGLRIRSAHTLGATGTDADVRAIEKAFYAEKSWCVQCEFALALGNSRSAAGYNALLRMARRAKHPRVKRAALDAIGIYANERTGRVVRKYVRPKSSYAVTAEALRAMGRTKDESLLPLLESALRHDSWSDIIRQHALAGITSIGTEKAAEILKKSTRYGFPQRARVAATQYLGLVGKSNPEIVDLLLDLTKDRFNLVQLAAVTALGNIGDERALERLKEIVEGHFEARVKRAALDAIRKIQPWTEADYKLADLQEKIAELQKKKK